MAIAFRFAYTPPMLLTLTEKGERAGELSFLLHKHPARLHEVSLNFGTARVFYPEFREGSACKVVLTVEIDPVDLVRSKAAQRGGWALGQYVNDRPYTASSFLSVAISKVFGTAMNGNCRDHPEFVEVGRDLEVSIPVISAPGGTEMLERLFQPLGYQVKATPHPLDPAFPDWGDSSYHRVDLAIKGTPLHRVLKHLFVLIPTLDRQKHYWVGPEEIRKLLDKGGDWLAEHPEKEWIAHRYLKFRRAYTNEALELLDPTPVEEEEVEREEGNDETCGGTKPLSAHSQRLDCVLDLVREFSPESFLDLGCGEGKLLVRVLDRTRIPRVTGMDVDSRSLEIAKERLERRILLPQLKDRLTLLHGSLIYRDERLSGYELAALVEVVEHLDSSRLASLERVVFEFAAPHRVIVTTPNRDYNVLFENWEPGQMRHSDHRFEWSRKEFRDWCERIGRVHGYGFEIQMLGEEHPEQGALSQLAIFSRNHS